jgi:hypothetical protein
MYVYALYTIFQCEFSCNSYYVMWWLYMEQYMIWSSSGAIFDFAFSGNGHYVIQRPYCCKIWYGHHQVQFLICIRWQWPLYYPETILSQNMIWSSSDVIFHFAFSGNGHYVIQILYCCNIWYGHHQVSFFISHSVVMVIMSFGDCIAAIYDMVIIECHCSFHIQW